MKIIILLNEVNLDGIGDFSHFIDIHYALTHNQNLSEYKFVSMIHANNRYEQVKNMLQQLNLSDYFLFEEDDPVKLYEQYPELPHYLSVAEQIIQISCGGFPRSVWAKMSNPKAVLKFIGEHELQMPSTDCRYETITASLGLSKGCYGLKLQQQDRLQPAAALLLMQQDDQEFVGQLLKHTSSSSMIDFGNSHFLMPAYFNIACKFIKFLLFIATNKSFSPSMNMAVHVSGLGNTEKFTHNFQAEYTENNRYFQGCDIKQIEIIQADASESTTYPVNEAGARTIYLFNGFYLSDNSYSALYRQALLAGVSGDNTLERSISAQALPFYYSTNDINGKNQTRWALSNIVEQLDIPSKTRSDLAIFFRHVSSFVHGHSMCIDRQEFDSLEMFKDLDVPAMIAAWPIVTDYLLKNHNFYDKLKQIFFFKRTPEQRLEFLRFFKEKEETQSDPGPIPRLLMP